MNENLENNIKQELESWNEIKDKVLNVIPVKEISFRTRALLSDILDRLELSRQDRQDLEKYIIYGGGENIEYIKSTIGDLINKVPELNYLIDNIQTVIPLLNKLDELFKDTDETLDSFKELYDTLSLLKTSINNLNTRHNNDIKKINDIINEIDDTINNNVLFKKDSPFEKGSADSSAILKGGSNNTVSAKHSTIISGKNNTIEGQSSTAEGEENTVSGSCAHVEGKYNIANHPQAHAEGKNTKAYSYNAHSEGENTYAAGIASHTEGFATIANNNGEHASGRYNKSTSSSNKSQATQFSIGVGTSDTNRKNAIEVKVNGDVYIIGIGGFTGSNSDSSKSVQEVINELVDIINQITVKVE